MERQFIERSVVEIVIESLTLIFINILALVGNTLVVLAFIRNPALRNVTNTFIIALSLSDIVMAIFPMPLSVGALISGQWLYGDIMCAIQGVVVFFLAFVSLQIMALTAVNRYYKIIKPLRCEKIFKRWSTICMIICACLISIALVASMHFTSPTWEFGFHRGKVICVQLGDSDLYQLIYTMFASVFFVIVPAIVIMVCYYKVFRKLRQHTKQLRARIKGLQTGQPDVALRQESALSRSKMAITRTLFGTVLGFFICWIPCFLIDILDVMQEDWFDRRVYLVYMYLAYTSSAINPLIYGILNPSFRREFFNMVTCENVPQ